MKTNKLRRRIMIGTLVMGIALIIIMTVGIGYLYYEQEKDAYRERIFTITQGLADVIEGDRILLYLETNEKDTFYDQMSTYLHYFCGKSNVLRLEVSVPREDGKVCLWSSDAKGNTLDMGTNLSYLEGEKAQMDAVMVKNPTQKVHVVRRKDYGLVAVAHSPIYDSKGEPVAVLTMIASLRKPVIQLFSYLVMMLGSVSAVVIVFMVVIYTTLGTGILHPINRLIAVTRNLRENLENDRIEDPDIHTGDELEELSNSFLAMEKDLRDYIRLNARITAEKERIGAELDVAAQIQEDMLPGVFPAFPKRRDFDIYATMDPAKEVGGDFYDFFLVDENHLALVIADVAGKGVPAALFMVISKTLIKMRTLEGGGPSRILRYVNNRLCEGNEAAMFVTVWMAIIDLTTGKGVAANAAHEHPAVRRKDGSWEYREYEHSLALGIMEDIDVEEHEFALAPGDSLYVYTDGVVEAADESFELFEMERLLASLNSAGDASPKSLLARVKQDLDAHVAGATQFDDITMLAMTYFGPEES